MKSTLIAAALLLVGTPMKSQAENVPNELRIMTYNVRGGLGMDERRDYDRAADVIRNHRPDLCALQELDSVTGRNGRTYALGEFAERTGMHGIFAKAIDYDGGAYGIGLLCREEPQAVKRIALPGREEARVLIAAEFPEYVFMATHFSLTEADQLTSIRMIDSIAALYPDKAVFLAGDLNFTPDSEPFKALRKSFLPLTDTKQKSWPADTPRDAIDYIWGYIGGERYYRARERGVIDAPYQSDHRPAYADVVYGPILRTDPYLQNPTGNGVTVTWLTNTPAYSWVEYGTDTADLRTARTLVDGQTMAGNELNKIRLEHLVPGQRYYYRIHSREMLYYGGYEKQFGGTAASPFYSFTLPAADTENFTAVIFNDLHQYLGTFDKLLQVIRNKGVKYDFAVFNGDCIDDPASRTQAVASLSHYTEGIGAEEIPVFFLRGNHEIRNAYSIGLRELFDYVGGKTYGAFSWGDTRFVLLDCGEDKPDDHWVYYGLNDFGGLRKDQVAFLQTELSSKTFKKAGKKVLVHHIPVYGNTDKYNPCLELWNPLLRKAPFAVALNGHTHRFAYHPAGSEAGNVGYPVVIGGGFKPEDATVMVLERQGRTMTLRVYGTQGDEKLKLDL
ncbi:endonuclease/exonuclease/phosphatase family protein [uncultured Rikenella sp.]|uniref:endonuclease/exonuclease/phosphatase family protein n=1 Tax=uncultured Rikenella sp. TaxID=368003 RepID=UPI00262D3627|nr:endonuclease/exonuclease/phosphatase family protein [uncultured Rikenella sp.]